MPELNHLSEEAAAVLRAFPGPVTLRPSKTKWVALTAAKFILFGISVLMTAWLYRIDPSATWSLLLWVFLAVTFIVIAIADVLALVSGGMWMKLDADGFEWRNLWSFRKRQRWADSTEFDGITANFWQFVVHGNTTSTKHGRVGELLSFSGKAWLPDTYGLGATDLAALMNAWRQRALALPG
jgi:hypothetical protein